MLLAKVDKNACKLKLEIPLYLTFFSTFFDC